MGRRKVVESELGRPVYASADLSEYAGVRGIIVVLKLGNAGGAKGVRKSDSI